GRSKRDCKDSRGVRECGCERRSRVATDKSREEGQTMATPVNPKPFLNELTGKPVMVKLKWGMEYK
ncbi:unnamed protein product, partial [Ectocarpus sp. 12 AP-2014]